MYSIILSFRLSYSLLYLLLCTSYSVFEKKKTSGEKLKLYCYFFVFTGWVDDSVFVRRNQDSNSDEVWSNGGAGQQAGAFTTGRQGRGGGAGRSNPPPPPPAVKPRSQVRLA